jgi:ubiquinol-cytochrome c reductase cytochrome c1 subunit
VLWAFGWGERGHRARALVEPTAEREFHKHPKEVAFSSDGPFGKWDLQQLQRGYQVYKESATAATRSSTSRSATSRSSATARPSEGRRGELDRARHRPGTGETNTRPGTPTDYFPLAVRQRHRRARANNNAVPPDLSLMAKARHDGPPTSTRC